MSRIVTHDLITNDLVFNTNEIWIGNLRMDHNRLRVDYNRLSMEGDANKPIAISQKRIEKIIYHHDHGVTSMYISVTTKQCSEIRFALMDPSRPVKFLFDSAPTSRDPGYIFITVDDHEKIMYNELKSKKRFMAPSIHLEEFNSYGIKTMFIGNLPVCGGELVADKVSFTFNGIRTRPTFKEFYDLNIPQTEVKCVNYCNQQGITYMFIATTGKCCNKIKECLVQQFKSPLYPGYFFDPREEYKFIYVSVFDPHRMLYENLMIKDRMIVAKARVEVSTDRPNEWERKMAEYTRSIGAQIPVMVGADIRKPVTRMSEDISREETYCILARTAQDIVVSPHPDNGQTDPPPVEILGSSDRVAEDDGVQFIAELKSVDKVTKQDQCSAEKRSRMTQAWKKIFR